MSSAGDEAVDFCRHYGMGLDPEQEFVLAHSLGERRDGKWAAPIVGVCEPRQNGKGEILKARELVGLYLLGERLITHSAHLFDTSLEAFGRLLQTIEENPDLDRRVAKVSHAHGKEGITLVGGYRIRFRARTKGGGRGFTGDLNVLDEAMELTEASQASLIPTLSATSVKGNPQAWYAGSAVDQMVHEHGVVFARIRHRGLRGEASVAWFEWAADYDDLADLVRPPAPGDPDPLLDREQWRRANPALDKRISEEFILQTEIPAMGRREFAVERLGVGDWPDVDGLTDNGIDLLVWDERADPGSRISGPPWFAFDVDPDQRQAAIGTAGRRKDGRSHLELVDHRPGTGWVVARCVELKRAWKPAGFLCDGASPASSLVPDLERAGVKVRVLHAEEQAAAYAMIVDAVANDRARHLGQPQLRDALKGAARRRLGDRHAWARRGSASDITPLVAVTIAGWGLAHAKRRRVRTF